MNEAMLLLFSYYGSLLSLPLLAVPVVARRTGRSFEWGAYFSIALLFVFSLIFLVSHSRFSAIDSWSAVAVASYAGGMARMSIMITGTALIFFTPAYVLVWWLTGKYLSVKLAGKKN